MAGTGRGFTKDSLCNIITQNGDLAKTLNSLRTVPGATNPFVVSSRNSSLSSSTGRPTTIPAGTGVQSGKK
jgi:hypothetical protein